jgi:hypothetical protein
MDKNKFWLGGRLFNMASPRLGAPTQRQARLQDGCPNDTQGILFNTTSPRLVAPTQCKARPQVGRPNTMQGTSASWAPQRTAAMQTQGTSVRPQVVHPNATQGTSVSWAPKRNSRRVRKMGAQTKNSSATKTSTQGSTRQKDKLEDG